MPATKSQPKLVKEVWDILVEERHPLTYGEVAEKLSSPGYRPIAQYMTQLLTPIMRYCDTHGLPRLNDLVVGKESRRPNYAPPGYDYWASHREIRAFDWGTIDVDESDFVGL